MPPSKLRASSSRSFHWVVRLKNARLAAGLSFSWTALLERSNGRSKAMPGMRTLVAPRAVSPNMEVIYYIFGDSSIAGPLPAEVRKLGAGTPLSSPSELVIAFAQEVANRRIGRTQRLFVRQEDDAEVLCPGTLAKAGAVHHHHMLLADQLGDKDVVDFRDVERGVCVEGAARRHTTDARSLGAPLHGQIAPRAQLAFDFGQVVLRSFERGFDCILLRMIGAQARAQQLVDAFQVRFDYGGF